MINRFIRNFLNGLHIIREVQQVQTVHVACLHQCAKNVCPAAVLSCGARMASSSSNLPSNRSKLSGEYSNNSGSTLLNDYRNKRTANLQLADLGKDAVAFALDPRGSRFIQQKLGRANPTGTAQLVDALRGHVLTLAKNLYGSHVIQTALKSVDKASQIEIINEILAQVIPLSFHEYGNLVIQCVLEHCTEQQKRPVLEQLHDNVHTLVTDQNGNFVIQHMLEHGLPEDRERIVRCLQVDIMKNTYLHSFCSVIEKCLMFGTTKQRNALIDQVCADDGTGKPPLLEMMKHPFANDVVLKMVDCADSAHRDKMIFAIEEHIPALLKRQQFQIACQKGRRRRRQKEEADKWIMGVCPLDD